MRNLVVALPDGTELPVEIEEQNTVAQLLKLLLANHSSLLKRISKLRNINYSEWRLSRASHAHNKVWTKEDLLSLHKPLEGSFALSNLNEVHASSLPQQIALVLFHVLSTIPVQLANLPHAPAMTVSFPIMASMTPDSLVRVVQNLFGTPNELPDGTLLKYSISLKPAGEMHDTVASLTMIEFRSNQPIASWMTGSLTKSASILGSWLVTKGHETGSVRSGSQRYKISSPQPVREHHTTGIPCPDNHLSEGETSRAAEFEALLDDLQIPVNKRDSLHEFPPEKRALLLDQEKRFSRLIHPESETHSPFSTKRIGEASASALDTNGTLSRRRSPSPSKRFSLSFVPDLTPQKSIDSGSRRMSRANSGSRSPDQTVRKRSRSPLRINLSTCPPKLEWERPKSPIKPQHTGSSWMSSWWHKPERPEDGAESYIARLQDKGLTGKKLLSELITLKVQLGTTRASWLTSFVSSGGLGALRIASDREVQGSVDLKNAIWLEALKCFRIILNTQIGFEAVVASNSLILYICCMSRQGITKVKIDAFDLLAGLCIASPQDGHKQVFFGLSQPVSGVRAARFSWMIECLLSTINSTELEILPCAELVRAMLTLMNSLINSWSSVEDRMALRQEIFCQLSESQKTSLKAISEDVKIQINVLEQAAAHDREDLRHELQAQDTRSMATDGERGGDSTASSDCGPNPLSSVAKEELSLKMSHQRPILQADVAALEAEILALKQQICRYESQPWTAFPGRHAPDALGQDGSETIATHVQTTEHHWNDEENVAGAPFNVVEHSERSGDTSYMDDFGCEVEASSEGVLRERSLSEDHSAANTQNAQQEPKVSRVTENELDLHDGDIDLQQASTIHDCGAADAMDNLSDQSVVMAVCPAGKKENCAILLDQCRTSPRKTNANIQQIHYRDLSNVTEVSSVCHSETHSRADSSECSFGKDEYSVEDTVNALESRPSTAEELASTSLQPTVGDHRISTSLTADLTAETSHSSSPGHELSSSVTRQKTSADDMLLSEALSTQPGRRPTVHEEQLSSALDSLAELLPRAAPPPPPPPPPPSMPVYSTSGSFGLYDERQKVLSDVSSPPPVPTSPPPPPPLPFVFNIKQKPRENDSELLSPPPPPPLPQAPPLSGPPSALHLRKAPPLPPALHTSRKAPFSNKSLKPFFWEKLAGEKLSGTIWADVSKHIENELHQELMLSDFEKYFAKESAATTRYGPSPFAKTRTLRQKVTLIDHQRAKNIEVMLARFKLSYSEIRDALLNMDDSRLGTTDQLRIMHKNAPTDEEIGLVSEYNGDVEALGNAEKYIIAMIAVPRIGHRLEALIYKRKFFLEAAEIMPELDIISKACGEIMTCNTLRDILALALTAGNILNASTFRGNAEGFRLESLMKLGEVRSSAQAKSGATLLHYLVAVQKRNQGGRFDLSSEMRHCAMAARISSQALLDNAAALSTGLKDISNAIDLSSAENSGDLYKSKMKAFVSEAEPIVRQLDANAAEVSDKITRALLYFGESTTDARVEDIFSILRTFMDLIEKVNDENTALSGKHILRSKTSAKMLSMAPRDQSFDGTLRAIRAGQHGREVSREVRDRPLSRVFPPPFQ